jgi:hypothetical protein
MLWNSHPSSADSAQNLLNPPLRHSLIGQRQPSLQSQINMQHVHKIAPLNSQDTSLDSQHSCHFLSNSSTKSGITRFQTNGRGLSQSSHSNPSTQTIESRLQDDRDIQALIDSHVQAVLHDRLEPKMKEFDERQLSFHRRISEADEKHKERTHELDRKHKECMKQIHKLDKQSEKFNHQVSDAVSTFSKCNTAMEKQSIDCQAKGLYLETM